MNPLEIAYISHPLGLPGEWIIIGESGETLFTAKELDQVQDYFDALLSECEF